MVNLKPHLKNPRIILPAATIGVLLPVSWYAWMGGAPKAAAASKDSGSRAVIVEAAQVEAHDMPVYQEGLGNIQAFYTVTLTARVDGEVQNVAFTEGQEVKKGDLLAQIDPRPFQAALNLAKAALGKDKAQLTSAQADLERYQALAPKELASKQQLTDQLALVEQLKAQIEGDEANVFNAQTQLGYTRIVSPIQGKTGIRKVDPGNIVHATDTAGAGIVVVTQMQPISCIFVLPQDVLPQVAEAINTAKANHEEVQVVAMSISQGGAKELDRGTLLLVDNEVDQATGSIHIKATFPNKNYTLWPGQPVTARLQLRTMHSALTIPEAAVSTGPDGFFTYVVKPDSTVEMRPVQIMSEKKNPTDQVIVTKGLARGEQVVTSNQYRLLPGIKVKVAPTAVAATAAKPGEKG